MNINQSSPPITTADGPLILIVDDSPNDLHIMRKALEGHGFRALVAKEGADYKAQQTDRIWGLRQGAVDYVVKPLSGMELVQKAQAALAA